VSTIGYGDVGPVNHVERQYTIFVALSGVMAFAFAMGNINSLIEATDGKSRRLEDKMQAVGEYLSFREVHTDLGRRVMSHFGGAWKKNGNDLFAETAILSSLPQQLKSRVLAHLALLAEREVPMLKDLEARTGAAAAVGRIFTILVPMHFLEREVIYDMHELGGEMWFVTASSVMLTCGSDGVICPSTLDENGPSVFRPHEFAKLRKAERNGPEPYIGHLSLFHEVCKLRPEKAVAAGAVEALSLTRAVLDHIRDFCPQVALFKASLNCVVFRRRATG
jgi:hypothetical protein